TWRFAIVIIAHMDDEVGLERGGTRRIHRKGPRVRIVAGLMPNELYSATRIAQHHDALGGRRGHGKGFAAHARIPNPRRQCRRTDADRKFAIEYSTLGHGRRRAVEEDR